MTVHNFLSKPRGIGCTLRILHVNMKSWFGYYAFKTRELNRRIMPHHFEKENSFHDLYGFNDMLVLRIDFT